MSITFYCTPGHGCAYDPVTELNIGGQYTDDVQVYCSSTSRTVISGDWPLAPEGCTLTPLDPTDTCPPDYVP